MGIVAVHVPAVEPLIDDAALVDGGAAAGRGRKDEFGVWEGRCEGVGCRRTSQRVLEGRLYKFGAKYGCAGASAMQDDECLLVGLRKGFDDQRVTKAGLGLHFVDWLGPCHRQVVSMVECMVIWCSGSSA